MKASAPTSSASPTRAPARNSAAFDLRPGPRYKARLAHYMYAYELKTMQEIGDELGVTRERVRQYIRAVEPGLDTAAIWQARTASKQRDLSEAHEFLRKGGSREDLHEQGYSWKDVGRAHALLTPAERAQRAYAMYQGRRENLIYSDEDCLNALRAYAAQGYVNVVTIEGYREWHALNREYPCAALIMMRFNYWADACEAAGVPHIHRPGNRRPGVKRYWTSEKIVETFGKLVASLGYFPTVSQYADLYQASGGKLPSRPTISVRFGSMKALYEVMLAFGYLKESA